MTQKRKRSLSKAARLKSLTPFYWVTGAYFVASIIYLFCRIIGTDSGQALWMFTILWALSTMNLFSLSRVIRLLFDWNDASTPERRAALVIPTFFWASLKFAFLGLIGALLFVFGKQAEGNPVADSAILLGVSTLAIVPLIGGLSWSIRQRA